MKRICSIVRIIYVLAFILLGLSFLPISCDRKNPAKTVYCLADVSRSISPETLEREMEIIDRFTQEARKAKATFRIIPFAESPSLAQKVFEPVRPIDSDMTNPDSALRAAAKLAVHDRLPEMLLISDGGENEGNILQTARQLRIPISTVHLPLPAEPEVSIDRLDVPFSVRQGEPFFVTGTISSNMEAKARVLLFENETQIDEMDILLQRGETSFSFESQAEQRNLLCKVILETTSDTDHENNTLSAIIEVRPPQRLLFLTLDPLEISPFIESLSRYRNNISILHPNEFTEDFDSMGKYDAIFLTDIPATSLSQPQIKLLDDYVRNRGGALFLTGGTRSFASGGYGDSELELILPVRSDYTADQDGSETAICFLIDRSGSMKGEKLNYAKSAVIETLNLLSGRDRTGVIVFDQSPQVVVPLQYALITPAMRQAVEKISSGGGTDITSAIREAESLLGTTSNARKFIVLLSDGIASPVDEDGLVQELHREKITLSTILSDENVQEITLRRLAEKTGGVFYRSISPSSIPRLFVNETKRIRQGAIEEAESVPVRLRENELTSRLPAPLPPLKGYVRTEAKNESEVLLAMPDTRPLLARWRLGLGTVTVWTSDITPRWYADWLSVGDTAPFWSCLIRQSVRALPRSTAPVIGYPVERALPTGGEHLLKRVAEISGGQTNPTPEEFFKSQSLTSVRTSAYRTFIFWAFLLFLFTSLADSLLRMLYQRSCDPFLNSR